MIYEEGNDKRIAKMQDKIRNASKRSVTFLTLTACKSEDQLEFKHPNILALFGKRENTFITTNFVNTKILKMVSHNTKYRFCTSWYKGNKMEKIYKQTNLMPKDKNKKIILKIMKKITAKTLNYKIKSSSWIMNSHYFM